MVLVGSMPAAHPQLTSALLKRLSIVIISPAWHLKSERHVLSGKSLLNLDPRTATIHVLSGPAAR